MQGKSLTKQPIQGRFPSIKQRRMFLTMPTMPPIYLH
jgi:hypothetical protein